MHVLAICATCGRHTLLERSLRLFIEQDYTGQHTLLIYNNSSVPAILASLELPDNKHVILINQHIDSLTGKPYTSLGAIYNDILKYIGPQYDIITHWDDDDLFLPNHIEKGALGLLWTNNGIQAYKPKYSYYRSAEGVSLTENTLEPSIFVYTKNIKQFGYSLTTTEQHLQWVNPLKDENKLFVDAAGVPTLVYNWGDTDIRTFKTSGDYRNPSNFNNYRLNSLDFGDSIVTPWDREDVLPYFNQVENAKNKKK
jgi:hypothetical protein